MKKRSLIALLLVGLMVFTSGCGAGGKTNANSETKAKKDVLIVAQGADPKTLDPYGTTDSPAALVAKQIYETLVTHDAKMNVIPGLAESWDIVDPTTYVFHLRKGVKFHNGEELTAKDVMFSFKKISASPHAESIRATIDFDKCKVVDDYTFEMKMSAPFGPILSHLAQPVMSIVNEKAYTAGGKSYGQNPIGTGPYKFVQWKTGDRIELTRFDEYWGAKTKTKDVVIRTIPETASRSIEVETGGIDLAVNILPSEFARLEKNPKVKVSKQQTFTTTFIAFTCNKKPMNDKKVRQAINYAINKSAILDVVYQGTGKMGAGPMCPTVWAFNDKLPQYDYNIEKAKALLAEAGYPNGFKITLTTSENQERHDVAEMVQEQLSKIGITVEIQTLEWGAFIDKVYVGAMDMFILGWSATTGDPDYALYASFHSSMFGEGGNMTFYSNPTVDELLTKGRTSTKEEERKEAYMKAQEIIWDEAPCVFLQHGEEISAYNANMKGFASSPDGYFPMSTFYFE